MDSEAVHQIREANLASNDQRVSVEFAISKSTIVHEHGKSIHSVTKILQNFWLNLVFEVSSSWIVSDNNSASIPDKLFVGSWIFQF